MRTSRHSVGDSKLGCVVWLVLLGLVAMILWEAVPAKVRSTEFFDYLDDQAKFAQRTSADEMKKKIMRRARELEIPLTSKNLKVDRRGGRIFIEAEYVMPLEFPGYTYNWQMKHTIDEPFFIF